MYVARGCSLVLLSLGLPKVSNLRVLHRFHAFGAGAPILVLSTEMRVRSGIRNLSLNTGSCLAGPFRFRRLRTHVHDLAHHGFVRRSIYLEYDHVAFSAHAERTDMSNAPLTLAEGRDTLLRCFLLRHGQVVDPRRVVRRL